MKKLRKLNLQNNVEVLNKNEMKTISGGYDTWYGWKCWCVYGDVKYMMSGSIEDVHAVAEIYCPMGEARCDAQL